MSALEQKAFSFNDFAKLALTLGTIFSMWYNLKLDIKDVKSEVSELKTYKTSDDLVINGRVLRLEQLAENTSNRANELEREFIRFQAIIPNRIPEIKDANND
jgi:hypothetical protein